MRILEKFLKIFKIKNSDGKCYYICGNEFLKPPLSLEEETKYLKEFSETQSLEARDKLIEHNMRLVIYVAKRYETNFATLEDLISIGTLGLIKAITSFKADKNIKLATYASRCIDNEILMFLRKSQKRKIEVSLDEPLNSDGEGNELLLEDVIAASDKPIDEELDDEKLKEELLKAVEGLNDREKEIISLRFGLNGKIELTQKETAELLGISQSYISRLEKKILSKLRLSLIH